MSGKMFCMSRAMTWMIGAGLALLTPAAALASLPEPVEPISNPDKPYGAYVIMLVLAGGLCAVAFKPSKRTHLD